MQFVSPRRRFTDIVREIAYIVEELYLIAWMVVRMFISSLGEMTLQMILYDSGTNVILARFVDDAQGKSAK